MDSALCPYLSWDELPPTLPYFSRLPHCKTKMPTPALSSNGDMHKVKDHLLRFSLSNSSNFHSTDLASLPRTIRPFIGSRRRAQLCAIDGKDHNASPLRGLRAGQSRLAPRRVKERRGSQETEARGVSVSNEKEYKGCDRSHTINCRRSQLMVRSLLRVLADLKPGTDGLLGRQRLT